MWCMPVIPDLGEKQEAHKFQPGLQTVSNNGNKNNYKFPICNIHMHTEQ